MLFLDEPTTGLDPRARLELWDVLDVLVGEGATILLTTQYLEEADRLADDIVVIDHGKVIARGDARELKRQVGGAQLFATLVADDDLDAAAAHVARIAGAAPEIDRDARSVLAPTDGGAARHLASRRRARRRRHRGRGPRPAPADARRRVPDAHRRAHRGRRRGGEAMSAESVQLPDIADRRGNFAGDVRSSPGAVCCTCGASPRRSPT